MAKLVQSLSSTLICIIVVSCQVKEQRIVNANSVHVKTSGGITFVNDTIFSGTLIYYYEDSTDTLSIQNYNNGREHGSWKRFYEKNKTAEMREFSHGKKVGVLRSWWPNGQQRSEYTFANDEYNGACRDWSADGILTRYMNYIEGHENGLQKLWDDNGRIRANYVARNGRNYGLTGVKACATIWTGDSLRVH
jgi:antitoxin component YwqK of YwqJK toxin-antitoxin module